MKTDYAAKLKRLKKLTVHLAEFEYLHDPTGIDSGQIDPNVLSAGGFPFYLSGLMHLIYENTEAPLEYENSTIYKKLLSFLEHLVVKSHENYTRPQLRNVSMKFSRNFLYDIDETILQDLLDFFEQEFTKNDYLKSYLNKPIAFLDYLSENSEKLGFISENVWIRTRMVRIKRFFTLLNDRGGFENLTYEDLVKTKEYIDHYINFLEFDKLTPDVSNISEYKVFWEAWLGYFVKYNVEENFPNCTVDVYIDLHSDTGICSLRPLASILGFSKSVHQKIYKLFVAKKVDVKINTTIFHGGDSTGLRVEHTKGNNYVTIYFSDTSKYVINGAFDVGSVKTPVHDQYAYLFLHLDKKNMSYESKYDQITYLSSFLNAKATLFEIYSIMDTKLCDSINIPKTKIIKNPTINFNEYLDMIYDNKIVIKEGGRCSTGGSEVSILETLPNSEAFKSPYIVNVLQKYVPSQFFLYEGKPTHGHIRKLSVLNSEGSILHFGYVIKLSFDTNSSAYKTMALVYTEEGNFLFGCTFGRTSKYFDALDKLDLKLIVSDEEFRILLRNVKENWVHAMYYLNAYFESDFVNKVNSIVDKKIVSELYRI